MKKILGITTIRSDYDLMSGLYNLLLNDPEIDFKLLVAGAHLSKSYGNTVELIKRDGFPILAEIESLIDGDSLKSRVKTASIMLQNSIDIVASWAPDLIIFAGDREDVLIAGMLGTYLNIPTVHFFGGDHEKDGHADTAVRHATSKLATAHVVCINEHRNRLIKMGEHPSRICVAGSIALDKFASHVPERLEDINLKFPSEKNLSGYALCIFHPLESEKDSAGEYFENILKSLKSKSIPACVSYPNTDPGNHAIIDVIRKYENDPSFWFYRNLDRDTFLSLYKNASFLIGNSSSGIHEAASIPLGAINVGERQKGRFAGPNVVFCDTNESSISESIETITSPQFQELVSNTVNPYGDGKSCKRAFDYIKNTDFASMRMKMEDPLAFCRETE